METGKLEIIGTSFLQEVRSPRERSAETGAPATPRTPVEQALCEICADVLGLSQIGIHDDFIELGGDSVQAAQITARVRELFGVELALRDVFEFRTVAQLAPLVSSAVAQTGPLPPSMRADRTGPLPLSFSQERMWFIHQLDPESVAYHVGFNLLLEGRLDEQALNTSFEMLVARHESLRTRFPAVEGQPTQVIAAHAGTPVTIVSLEHLPESEREVRLRELVRAEWRRPFDLEHGPLFRVTLFRLEDTAHVLQVSIHHIISDAWSLGVLMRQVALLYNAAVTGQTAALPELKIQPADFAVWERGWMGGEVAVGISVANRKLPATECLISAFVNTLVMRTDLSGDPTVRELLARERETALNAYAHQDMPFAKLVAELNPERRINQAPLVQVMYNFINVPVPDPALHGVTAKLVTSERGGAQFDLSLMATDLPLLRRLALEYNTDLFERATIERMLGHLVNLLHAACRNPNARVASLEMLSEAQERALLVEWNATASDYAGKSIVARFEEQAARRPAATALRFGDEKLSFGELNARANQLAHSMRGRGLERGAFVGVCVERSPEMVIALLAVLKAGGAFVPLNPAFPRERLGLMLRETGAPLVLTQERLLERVADAGAAVICLDRDRSEMEREAADNLEHTSNRDEAAYVIYTSGSTGEPKGVVGTQRGMANALAWFETKYPYGADAVACLRTPLNFVDSIREIFGPLVAGVPCVLLGEEAVHDPRVMMEQLATHGVTRIAIVPSLLRTLLDLQTPLKERLPRCREWFVSGEALSGELCVEFRNRMPGCVLVNLYGCSEAAGDSLYFDASAFEGEGVVPIGRPLANTQVFILDGALKPVPVGVKGELYIGGAGVALGYLKQPQLTHEKFGPNPFYARNPTDFSRTLYRTGDLACYLPDGNIKFHGRDDQQVKLRGIRVELGEVEAALRQHQAVSEAVVLAQANAYPHQRLSAYVVPRPGMTVSATELRHALQARMPNYMIPSSIAMLNELPYNASGKVDKSALARRNDGRAETEPAALANSMLERQLQTIWERVLGISPIGIRDDFFELGGHSLLAVRLFAEIEGEFGYAPGLTTLFQTPTIEGLAEEMQALYASARQPRSPVLWSPLVPLQDEGTRAPFFCVHGLGGGVLDYTRLSRLLGRAQPFFGLQAIGNEPGQTPDRTVEAMAARLIGAMRTVQPQGPYQIGGYSYGGTVAFEIARQLEALGEQTALLAIFDQPAPHSDYWQVRVNGQFVKGFARNFPIWLRDFWGVDRANKLGRFGRVTRARTRRAGNRKNGNLDLRTMVDDVERIPHARQALMRAHLDAMLCYTPQPIATRVTIFRAERQPLWCSFDLQLGWGALTRGGVEVRQI